MSEVGDSTNNKLDMKLIKIANEKEINKTKGLNSKQPTRLLLPQNENPNFLGTGTDLPWQAACRLGCLRKADTRSKQFSDNQIRQNLTVKLLLRSLNKQYLRYKIKR
jgi:hypothetical protein